MNNKIHKPGEICRQSGQYVIVDATGQATGKERTVVKDKSFPPTPEPNQGYLLVDITQHGDATINIPNKDHFQKLEDELEKIKGQIVLSKEWFRRNSSRPRILFQLVGFLVVLLSISIPLLSVVEGIWNTAVLPVVAVAIAGLTSLNSFFQWQSQWQARRQTQFALEYLLLVWELDIAEAKLHPDEEKSFEMAIEATRRLLDNSREATSSSTSEYFKTIQLPKEK